MTKGKRGQFYDDDDLDDGYDDEDYYDDVDEYGGKDSPAVSAGKKQASTKTIEVPQGVALNYVINIRELWSRRYAHLLLLLPHRQVQAAVAGRGGPTQQQQQQQQRKGASAAAHAPARTAGASKLAQSLCDPPPPGPGGKTQRGGTAQHTRSTEGGAALSLRGSKLMLGLGPRLRPPTTHLNSTYACSST